MVKEVKNVESAKYSMNKTDLLKILKGAMIALGGALCAFLLDLLPQIDWGSYAYLVIPIASVLINAVIKYLSGKRA